MPVSDEDLPALLARVGSIAVVGFSPRPDRPSHYVARFLADRGYRVFPVNPGHAGETIGGMTVHARLADIPEPVDMVDVFRASEHVAGVLEETLALEPRPRVFWTQLGVRDDAAAARAEAEGLAVVIDRCPKIVLADR